MGTGAAFDGAIFASYTKTIVVTINYRLGPFGKIISQIDCCHRLDQGSIISSIQLDSLIAICFIDYSIFFQRVVIIVD